MKKLLFLLCVCALCACEINEPNREDDTQKHQPADPTTWSPAGKYYTYLDTISAPYKLVVFNFATRDTFYKYSITNPDYPIYLEYADDNYEIGERSYTLDYPNVIVENEVRERFIDTLTLQWGTLYFNMTDIY